MSSCCGITNVLCLCLAFVDSEQFADTGSVLTKRGTVLKSSTLVCKMCACVPLSLLWSKMHRKTIRGEPECQTGCRFQKQCQWRYARPLLIVPSWEKMICAKSFFVEFGHEGLHVMVLFVPFMGQGVFMSQAEECMVVNLWAQVPNWWGAHRVSSFQEFPQRSLKFWVQTYFSGDNVHLSTSTRSLTACLNVSRAYNEKYCTEWPTENER